MFLLLVSSLNALAYNLVHAALIQRTSAVTTTVLGEVKIVGLLVLRCRPLRACISCCSAAAAAQPQC